jgi:hypothetical protein
MERARKPKGDPLDRAYARAEAKLERRPDPEAPAPSTSSEPSGSESLDTAMEAADRRLSGGSNGD